MSSADTEGSKRRNSPVEVICIDLTESSSSDESGKNDDTKPTFRRSPRKRVKREGESLEAAAPADDIDDEIEVLDAPSHNPVASVAISTTADDEIELVGTVNEQKLPHMRQHCLDKSFCADGATTARQLHNLRYCDLCYCYVCDIPAKDCKEWNSHCCATDKGRMAYFWKEQRAERKRRLNPSSTTNDRASQARVGLFSNSNSCRHCGAPHRFLGSLLPSTNDWCDDCGRVAWDQAFDKKTQSDPYEAGKEDLVLGSRMIPFTLHTRDPREMAAYKDNWARNSSDWTFDVQDMESEFFEHRLGKHPTLPMILASIPILKQIPTDGDTRGGRWDTSSRTPSPSELDAILLENRNHRVLLSMLHEAGSSPRINYSIEAQWDTDASRGTFQVTVYVRPTTQGQKEPVAFAAFLGAWYDIFPFRLQDLCGVLPVNQPERPSLFVRLSVPPFRMSQEDAKKATEDTGFQERIACYTREVSEAVSSRENARSMVSSSPKAVGFGGTSCSPAETDLASILKRYYQEMFPMLASRSSCDTESTFFCDGLESRHRAMRQSVSVFCPGVASRSLDGLYMDSFLTLPETVAAETMFQCARHLTKNNEEPLKSFMTSLENLGHRPTPAIEGLNLELLPFQKESVQWASERELTPGGIKSYTWAKLPDANLYYNPATRKLVAQKPKVVKGGIIADQMGMGKTVVSLALILKNPAPSNPVSGSGTSSIPRVLSNSGAFWDPELAPRKGSMAGSILSQGTLVVCTVSLVGQWIEEAKSKLTNPGLVYPYHGGSRKRDPKILARSSIVVTTYETLSSDRIYHKNKSKDPDSYCAPCEQIRWWRIICDESHILRNGGGKLDAVKALHGENKWIVTGTPLCTKSNDLKNQLAFLGMQEASPTVSPEDFPKKSRSRFYCPTLRLASNFLLRPIMMRHSQQQMYRGTSTTLMSLPPKTERVVEVALSADDQVEYDKLETSAQKDFFKLKASAKKIGTHALRLRRMLEPLQTACSGGRAVLPNTGGSYSCAVENEDKNKEGKGKKPNKVFSRHSFASKFEMLIQELKLIRENDTTSKVLVFSQFGSTLKFLQQELPNHGFQFRTLAGDMPMNMRTKALHDFQHDPATTIFLLSIRAGAVGINLTQANHVFLMDPCFSRADEAQAVGRVYRLGQKRSVEITRLIVQNSFESRLVEMLDKKYGNKTGAVTNDDSSESEGEPADDARPAALETCVVEDEYDLLFGVSNAQV